MQTRLAVSLPPGWTDISHDNVDGPPTYVRQGDASGSLQISIQAQHAGGVDPDPTAEQLIALAEGVVLREESAEVRGRAAGQCVFGHYGTVLARVDAFSWVQIWVLSNGRDFMMATHICADEPSEVEVNEAGWIVKHADLWLARS